MNCTSGETAVALWFLIVGVWIAFGGVGKWLRTKAFSWRETPLAIAGALGAVIGLWMTIVQIRCGFPLPKVTSLVGPLVFTYWAPQIPFVVFAAFAAWQQSKTLKSGRRIAEIALWGLFAFAGSEAAAYHTGAQGTRWFVLAMVTLVGGSLVLSFYDRRARSAG